MMVTLRLYRQHDLDLITLYRHPLFSLPNAIKMSLCGYVRNQKFFINQPEPYEIGNEKISKIVQIHIQLSEKTEKDVIDWLKNIKDGYRNSVLKNVIRAYMAGPCIYSYIKENEDAFENASGVFDTFKSNIKETVDIKGRTYTKSLNPKVDNRKVEDSTLAASILKDKPAKKEDTFVENISAPDVKKLEEITKVEKQEEIKPKKEVKIEPVKEIKEEIIQDDAESLDDMLDDIDAMMDDF